MIFVDLSTFPEGFALLLWKRANPYLKNKEGKTAMEEITLWNPLMAQEYEKKVKSQNFQISNPISILKFSKFQRQFPSFSNSEVRNSELIHHFFDLIFCFNFSLVCILKALGSLRNDRNVSSSLRKCSLQVSNTLKERSQFHLNF